MKPLDKWSRIALVNLAIVALLGLLLRCKMIFSIPFLDFKPLLHAHSHFAFGGWVTLALLSLMTFQLLPSQRRVYQFLLRALLVTALGMLLSFPFHGYGFFSILFSTLFIFATYGYACVFMRDIRRAPVSRAVRLLATGAVGYMVLSSAGAFTLGYLLATRSSNLFLYKDAIYTYLHLQYSGFFTLAVFALALHLAGVYNVRALWFARLLHVSVIPVMCISYLWHYPGMLIRLIAIAGSVLLAVNLVFFVLMLPSLKSSFLRLQPVARRLFTIAMAAFILKTIFQALTIIPSLGTLVFANRPVIIGFLHLVLLAFVTLYLLGHFLQSGLIAGSSLAYFAIGLFTAGVLLNELVLFGQGLGFMLMVSGALTSWLLLLAAALLFGGAALLAVTYPHSSCAQKPFYPDTSIRDFFQP